ncbi:MAG: serine/threonine-protein kinase, partial [Gemmatimonadaceae bacterium]|nr:serine/threonine-protein kinase [Gemmatimonadaceae bacterium]
KTTAKLQHPHILPLLDSGEADGLLFYVMPYVAGESLRTRLERETQLAVDDAVRIGREVASALESAHRQGVIHRDIKPENILLHEDQALVADFGIALAVSAAGGPRMTQTGLSLGTPAYMAPEQAMGERVIDGRADIYALGAVLYEMLVGEAPFTGPTVQAIVARVMTEQPRALSGQRRSIPAHVNAAVLRALEKLPADRFNSAAQFSSALVTPGFVTAVDETRGQAPRSRLPRLLRRPALAWGVAAAAAVIAALSLMQRTSGTDTSRAARLSVELPPGTRLNDRNVGVLQLNADASMIAIEVISGGINKLVLRRMDLDSVYDVRGSENVTGQAAFSADGRWIAFFAEGQIRKAPVTGGSAAVLAPANWGQISWIGNDAIVYTRNYNTGLHRVSAEGRDSATLTVPDRKRGELGHWWPQVLPDGKHVLFTTYLTPPDKSRIEVLSLETGKRTTALEGAYHGQYTSGQLLFARGGVMMTVPFDAGARRVTGSPIPVDLDILTDPSNGWAASSVAVDGTLAYVRGASKRSELVWRDQLGEEEPAIDSAARYSDAAPSPDGLSVAVIRDGDVWTFDRDRRIFTRLTRTEQTETNLIWTPDSREVIYNRDTPQYDLFKRVADASQPEELVLTSPVDKEGSSVSPDGAVIIYDDVSKGDNDVWAAPLDRRIATGPQLLAGGPGSQVDGRFSNDGKWIAYTSNESGRSEIYMLPYPVGRGPGRKQ